MSEYIVYACPRGVLGEQIERYFAASRTQYGLNAAHRYPPHCTLTGFFHDQEDALGVYTQALAEAQQLASACRPARAIEITDMQLGEQWHGLTLESAWLKGMIASFAQRAASPTRRDALRLKDWLHLSLAYEFPAAQREPLARLAQAHVDPAAQVAWELRLYERQPGDTWTCHSAWPL
ncbi:MAG: hypothetical protein H7Z42_17215 [Roseiflexaceae bacterium]|nr:hypothetical protein [Roseiflexaceae bacterium]